jgi:hypothetical protein
LTKKAQADAKELFLQTMEKTFGNISQACKAIGISRITYYRWLKDDKEFREECESDRFKEAYLDAIEGKLAKLGLVDENPTILIFLAKTLAKNRGYVEKSIVENHIKELPQLPEIIINVKK